LPSVASDRPHFAHWPKRLPRELVIPETSLWFNLEAASARYPDKPAYLYFGEALAFRALKAQAEAIAGWLQKVGVSKGDRVVVYMQNCPQFVAALYGVLRADAVVVPVNPMNRAEEFQHYITDPQAKVAICAGDLAAVVNEANQALPVEDRLEHVIVTHYSDAMPSGAIDPSEARAPAMDAWLRSTSPLPQGGSARFTRWPEVIAAGRVPGPHTALPDDLALLPYTSGTTGLPKGCMHTHRSLMSNAVSGQWSYASPEVTSLGVVPYWTCIPTMIIDLFASPSYKSFDLSSLPYVSGGGAAMPHAVAERLRDEFGLTFVEGYGLTETAAPSHANPPSAPSCSAWASRTLDAIRAWSIRSR